MAIKKAIDTPHGVAALYHKIEVIIVEYAAKRVTVDIASFVSSEARAEGKTPIQYGRTLFENQEEHSTINTEGNKIITIPEKTDFSDLGEDFSRTNIYKHLTERSPFWIDGEKT